MKKAFVTITAAFLFCSTLMAQGTESTGKSLKGLSGITVEVSPIKPDAEQAGLSSDQIQTDVELRLRLAGIKVGFATHKEFSDEGSPILRIVVDTLKHPDIPGHEPFYFYHVGIYLQQDAILARDRLIRDFAVTWDTGTVGSVGTSTINTIRDDVKDGVDKFINAWLSPELCTEMTLE